MPQWSCPVVASPAAMLHISRCPREATRVRLMDTTHPRGSNAERKGLPFSGDRLVISSSQRHVPDYPVDRDPPNGRRYGQQGGVRRQVRLSSTSFCEASCPTPNPTLRFRKQSRLSLNAVEIVDNGEPWRPSLLGHAFAALRERHTDPFPLLLP